LSTLYRTQAAAQNKQLSLSDALRDRDEEARGLREEVRVLREQKETAGRREKEWDEKWRMRTRDMEVGTVGSNCVRGYSVLALFMGLRPTLAPRPSGPVFSSCFTLQTILGLPYDLHGLFIGSLQHNA
jgi:hypothetical protein